MPDLPARFAALILTFAPLFVQRSWLHASYDRNWVTSAIMRRGLQGHR